MKKLYIITGAAGHLGSTVIGMLKGKDCEVRGLILPEEQAEDTENVTFYKGDVTKPDTLRPLFENRYGKETYVIHTAGIVDIQNAVSPLIYNVNVNGTKNILRLCREYGVKRLVYVSSVHARGSGRRRNPGGRVVCPGDRNGRLCQNKSGGDGSGACGSKRRP